MVVRLEVVQPETVLRLVRPVLVRPVLARQGLRLEPLGLLERALPGQMEKCPGPGRFASLPVGSAMRRLACRPVFAPMPVKAEGQWRAARLER